MASSARPRKDPRAPGPIPRKVRVRMILFVALATVFITAVFYGYQVLFTPNVAVRAAGPQWLYIPTGATFEQVMDTLERRQMVHDPLSFRALARATGYRDAVRPGAYQIHPDSHNLSVLRMLKNGRQTPVSLVVRPVRLPGDLAKVLSRSIEADSATLVARLTHPDTCAAYGFTPQTMTAMFLPNTYQVYWNLTPTALWRRMKREYDNYWTPDRRARALALGLDPVQVTTLASIVYAETKKADEMPTVAGVYLNRLKAGMPLQADPTVVYAVGDFSIRRVLTGHLKRDSPYNTYLYKGLPPGPINLPPLSAIEATLFPGEHKYLYFVARKDFSGYHTFAEDYATHLRYAAEYRKALEAYLAGQGVAPTGPAGPGVTP